MPHTHIRFSILDDVCPVAMYKKTIFDDISQVQCMKPKTWARVPNRNLVNYALNHHHHHRHYHHHHHDNIIVIIIPFKVNHALKLSDIRGWSLLSEDPVSMIAIHIPEEDR